MAAERIDVTFSSGSDVCAGWWWAPPGDGSAPVVVLGIGLGSIKEMGLDRYGAEFAAAGYAVLAFDYRHFGASEGEPRQLLDVRRQLDDFRAAIAFARRQPGVDRDRVVVWGTSFGGGHAISLAAERPDGVVAALAQCPMTDGLASAAVMSPHSALKVGFRAVRDVTAALLGRQPVMVATAGPERSAALMSAPDALTGFSSLVPDGSAAEFRNEVAARIGLRIMAYRPGLRARQIQLPIWVGVCDHDTVAPPRRTLRLMRRARQASVRRYATGHFEIYHGRWFEQAVTEQLAFLRQHVPVS